MQQLSQEQNSATLISQGQRVEHVMKMKHKGNEREICKNRVNSFSERPLLAQTNGYNQKSKLQKSLPHVKSAKIHILYFLQCKFLKDFQVSKRKFLPNTWCDRSHTQTRTNEKSTAGILFNFL